MLFTFYSSIEFGVDRSGAKSYCDELAAEALSVGGEPVRFQSAARIDLTNFGRIAIRRKPVANG